MRSRRHWGGSPGPSGGCTGATGLLMGTCLVTAFVLYYGPVSLAVGHRHTVELIHVWAGYALAAPLLLGLAVVGVPRRPPGPEPVHPGGLALAAVEEPARRLVRGRQVQRRPEAQRRAHGRLDRRPDRHRDADVLDRAGAAGLADRRDVRARLVRARARAAGARPPVVRDQRPRGPRGDADRPGQRGAGRRRSTRRGRPSVPSAMARAAGRAAASGRARGRARRR